MRRRDESDNRRLPPSYMEEPHILGIHCLRLEALAVLSNPSFAANPPTISFCAVQATAGHLNPNGAGTSRETCLRASRRFYQLRNPG